MREVHIQNDQTKLARLSELLTGLRLNTQCDPQNIPQGTVCYEYPVGREVEFEEAAESVGLSFQWGIIGGGNFSAWNVDDPTAPSQVGTATLASSNLAAVIFENPTRLWASSAGNSGNAVRTISAINIADVTAPEVLSNVILGNANTRLGSIAILGSTLYLISDGFASESTFLIADGSDPTAPTETAVYDLSADFALDQLGPTNIVAAGSHTFILSSQGSVTGNHRYFASYDVTDPEAVTQADSVDLQTVSNPGHIQASGKPAMVMGDGVAWILLQGLTNDTEGRLIAVDVADPTNLAVLSDNAIGATTDAPRGLFLLGTTLYITSSGDTQKIFIYDVSDPTTPALSSTLTLTQPGIGSPLAGIFVRGSVIYLITGNGSEGSKRFVLYNDTGTWLSSQNLNSVGGLALIGPA